MSTNSTATASNVLSLIALAISMIALALMYGKTRDHRGAIEYAPVSVSNELDASTAYLFASGDVATPMPVVVQPHGKTTVNVPRGTEVRVYEQKPNTTAPGQLVYSIVVTQATDFDLKP